MMTQRRKIVLCTLPSEGEYRSWITPTTIQPAAIKYMPLGLLSLATNLPNHDVKIIDVLSEGLSIEESISRINAECADIVGFSAVSRRAFSLYQMLPRILAEFIAVGGPHCTNYHQDILDRGADAVFVGGLADLDFARWCEFPTRNTTVYCTTKINDIKPPDRSLIDYQSYFYSGKVLFESAKRMSMFSSVGCPNRCSFCTVQGKSVQWKDSSTVVLEMLDMVSLGAEFIHIMDDNFNINRRHVRNVLDHIEAFGMRKPWSIRGQVRFDLSLVPDMRALGLRRVHVGIESLDDDVLHWMRKNQTVADIERFCKAMVDNGIEVVAYFIVGTPREPSDYIERLPDMIRKLGITMPYVNVLFPEPDTEYYRGLVSSGVYDYDIWHDYFENPTKDFIIPSPVGFDKQVRLIEAAERIVKEFM